MNNILNTLFLDNPKLEEKIEAFCASDPKYAEAERQFFDIARKIAPVVGFDLYNSFENCLIEYMQRSTYAYYLFGLGLRQEVLSALESCHPAPAG